MKTYGISLNNNQGEPVEITTTQRLGTGILTVTGKVSDDILNSIKNSLQSLQVPSKTDIDINITGGRLPLSGPSLGLAIYKSLAGALNSSTIDKDIIYTGEIDQIGNIHQVGEMRLKHETATNYNKTLQTHL